MPGPYFYILMSIRPIKHFIQNISEILVPRTEHYLINPINSLNVQFFMSFE